MKRLLALASALFVTACAADPDSIQPAYISSMTYEPYNCDQLAQEEVNLQTALANVSQTQRQARSQDTWGVALLGLPVSSLSGSNVASQVAQVKGSLNALHTAEIQKNCATAGKTKPAAS